MIQDSMGSKGDRDIIITKQNKITNKLKYNTRILPR